MSDDDFDDRWARAFSRIVKNAEARRELLWLRAMEKEDEVSIEMLERADPGLRSRMHALLASNGVPANLDAGRATYVAIWHAHFEALTARFGGV
jgi:hypothetical protein